MGSEGQEVGQLEPRAEKRVGEELGHEEAAGRVDRRVGHREAGQVAHGHAGEAELGILEVDPAFLGVVDDPVGADFPQRRGVRRADPAACGDGVGELDIAAVHAVDPGRGDLELLVEHHLRAEEDAVAEVRVKFGAGGEDGDAFAVGQRDRPVDEEPLARAFVADGGRGKADALEEHLDVAGGGDRALALHLDPVGDQRGEVLRRGGRGGERARATAASAAARRAGISRPPDGG